MISCSLFLLRLLAVVILQITLLSFGAQCSEQMSLSAMIFLGTNILFSLVGRAPVIRIESDRVNYSVVMVGLSIIAFSNETS